MLNSRRANNSHHTYLVFGLICVTFLMVISIEMTKQSRTNQVAEDVLARRRLNQGISCVLPVAIVSGSVAWIWTGVNRMKCETQSDTMLFGSFFVAVLFLGTIALAVASNKPQFALLAPVSAGALLIPLLMTANSTSKLVTFSNGADVSGVCGLNMFILFCAMCLVSFGVSFMKPGFNDAQIALWVIGGSLASAIVVTATSPEFIGAVGSATWIGATVTALMMYVAYKLLEKYYGGEVKGIAKSMIILGTCAFGAIGTIVAAFGVNGGFTTEDSQIDAQKAYGALVFFATLFATALMYWLSNKWLNVEKGNFQTMVTGLCVCTIGLGVSTGVGVGFGFGTDVTAALGATMFFGPAVFAIFIMMIINKYYTGDDKFIGSNAMMVGTGLISFSGFAFLTSFIGAGFGFGIVSTSISAAFMVAYLWNQFVVTMAGKAKGSASSGLKWTGVVLGVSLAFIAPYALIGNGHFLLPIACAGGLFLIAMLYRWYRACSGHGFLYDKN